MRPDRPPGSRRVHAIFDLTPVVPPGRAVMSGGSAAPRRGLRPARGAAARRHPLTPQRPPAAEQPPGCGRPPSPIGPLASQDFRLLSVGQLTSTIGDFCYAVALPWLILSAHGGPVLLGAVLACYRIPAARCSIPVGGVLADKIGPRTVMLAADAVRCVLVAALAVIAARHMVSLAALGPVAALVGSKPRACSTTVVVHDHADAAGAGQAPGGQRRIRRPHGGGRACWWARFSAGSW